MKIAAIVLALLVVAGMAWGVFRARGPRADTVTSPTPAPAQQPPHVGGPPPPQAARLLELSHDADAENAISAVEKMIAPRHAAVATSRGDSDARFICLLIEGDERQYSLDIDVAESDLPFLKRYGFAMAPPPLYRTTSMYQSAAKTALHYDQLKGDRLIVLICPASDWPVLRMESPQLHLPPLPTPSHGARNESGF